MKLIDWRHAVCRAELDPTAKLVALVISCYMNGAGIARPSRKTIADSAGLSVRAIEYATRRAEEAGFLYVKHSLGRHSNHYFATLNGEPRCAVEEPSTAHLTSTNGASDDTNGEPRCALSSKSEIDNEIDGDGVVAFEEALEPLGRLTASQRREALKAWQVEKQRVRTLIDDVLGAGGVRSPVALFVSRLRTLGDSADPVDAFLREHDGKWPTGSRWKHSGPAGTYRQDALGYDRPTHEVSWGRPTRAKIAAALAARDGKATT